MNPEPNAQRDTEIRRALVATVDLTPLTRRRPPVKLVIGAIAAFALAGALTGGAVANANTVDPVIANAQDDVQISGALQAHQQDLTLIGQPFERAASGSQTINLGPRPSGATDILEAFQCIDPGKYTGFLDTKQYEVYPDCEPTSTGGTTTRLSGNGAHIVTIQAPPGARFAIWLSWAKSPNFVGSAATKAALADGIITRAELLAASSRYEGCISAFGHTVTGSSSYIALDFELTGNAVDDGSNTRCESTELKDVDVKWDWEIQHTDIATPSVEACLAQLEVVPASTPEQRYAQLQDHQENLDECHWIQG